MNLKTIRNLSILTSSYSLIFCSLLLLAWYAISGSTFRAVFYILQGYTSHYVAMALASAGLYSNAIQVQELSIKAYEESDANLASDELKALSSDELGHLAALHLKCKNRPAAMQAAQRIETIFRQRLDDTATDKTRWRRALADVLLYQARILYNDNQTKDSAEKYKESIAINQALLDQKQGNAASENQLSSARKELAQLTNNSVDPQPTAIISP